MAEYIENVLAQTSKLDWAFPFERKGQFPLDKSALFSSLEDAQKYATGSATDERKLGGTSYVGQIISVYEPAVEANEAEGIAAKAASVSAFIITPARGLIKLAATTASGDVAADIADLQGKVTALLADVEALEKAIGNAYTKSEVDELIANAKDERVDGLVEDVEALETAVGAPAGEGAEASGLYKAVADEAARATAAEKALGERIDGIDFVDETELATALEPYAKTADVETAIDNAVKGVLGEGVDEAYNTLKEIQDILEGTDGEAIDGLIESVAANKAAIEAEVDRATKAEAALDEAIKAIDFVDSDELTTALEPYAKSADIYTKSEVYTKGEADQAIADKISEVNGGESAGEVLGQLNAYKKIVNMEVWGDEAGTGVGENGDSRIDLAEARITALEGVGAQENVIESVVAATDAKIKATKSGKEVTIDDSALVALIDTAQTQANKGVADAKTALEAAQAAQGTADSNAGNITTLQGRVNSVEGTIAEHASSITDHGTRLAAVESKASANETAILSKADKSTVEGLQSSLGALEGTVGGHTTEIAAINTTLGTKADTSALGNYYTKEEINNKTGVIPDGSSLMAEIAKAQNAATYDDTEVRGLISNNASAITTLIGSVEGDNTKSVRTIANEEVAKVVDSAPEAFDTLKEIADWIADDETGAAALTNTVASHTTTLADITNAETGILAQAKGYTDTQIPAALAAYTVKSVKSGHEAITVSTDENGVATIGFASDIVLNGGSATV